MLPRAPDRCPGLFQGQGARYVGCMRITCPTCTAAYDVPDARIVPGQGVRCARCGADWVPLQAASAPADDVDGPKPTLSSEPEALALAHPLPILARNVRNPPFVLAGWVLSAALLACLAWAAYAWRTDIMRQWPPSQRMYAAFGLVGAPLSQ